MITSVWISPDRARLIVQCDGEDGPITEINTDATYPDGVSFECLEVDAVDASFTDVYGPGTALVANALANAVHKLTTIRKLVDTHRQRGTALAYETREVLDS